MTDKDNYDPFKEIGGWPAIIKFGKQSPENFSKVLSIYGAKLLEASGHVDVQHVSPIIDDAAIATSIEAALAGIVNARRERGDRVPAVVTSVLDGGVSDVTKANPALTPDIGATPKAIAAQALPDSTPDDAKTNKPSTADITKPAIAKPAQHSEPTAPYQPSATELFYSWSGHSRPTWSPPRGWSGS
jgi:hypothetical protein